MLKREVVIYSSLERRNSFYCSSVLFDQSDKKVLVRDSQRKVRMSFYDFTESDLLV